MFKLGALRKNGWLVLPFLVAIALRGYQLGAGGLGDPTAAGTVRSMLHSWSNFFFVAWDPAGTYMHDKPPLALWLQAASAYLLGYHGFALALPQALAGLGIIAFSFRLVSLLHDRTQALITAWLLASLPLTVLVERSNKQDAILALCMVACVSFLAEAMRTRKVRYLLLAAVAFGCGFNVKGLAIGMIVPAAGVLLWHEGSWRAVRRWPGLLAAAMPPAALSLAWLVVVDLTPPDQRPWVMNSDHNRILDLTLQHNGVARLSAGEGFNPARHLQSAPPGHVPLGLLYGGARGATRILGEFPGGLLAMTWPLFGAGLLLFLLDLFRTSHRPASLTWLLWLLAGWLAFSFSRLGSPHYLELFAVPWAVTTAYGGSAALHPSSPRRTLGLTAMATTAIHALVAYHGIASVGPLIAAAAAGALLLLAYRLRAPNPRATLAALGCLAVIPVGLSMASIRMNPTEGSIPGASFLAVKWAAEGRPLREHPPGGDMVNGKIGAMEAGLAYVRERVGPDARYLVAVQNFTVGSAIIAHHDRSVLAVRNEFRNRNELTGEAARRLIQEGNLRYFLIPRAYLGKIDPALNALLADGREVAEEAGYAPGSGWMLIDARP